MVAANVSAMEEQVVEAEGEARTLPGAFKKIFRTMNVSGFLNVSNVPKRYANKKPCMSCKRSGQSLGHNIKDRRVSCSNVLKHRCLILELTSISDAR